jgi:hypothetical protein
MRTYVPLVSRKGPIDQWDQVAEQKSCAQGRRLEFGAFFVHGKVRNQSSSVKRHGRTVALEEVAGYPVFRKDVLCSGILLAIVKHDGQGHGRPVTGSQGQLCGCSACADSSGVASGKVFDPSPRFRWAWSFGIADHVAAHLISNFNN